MGIGRVLDGRWDDVVVFEYLCQNLLGHVLVWRRHGSRTVKTEGCSESVCGGDKSKLRKVC